MESNKFIALPAEILIEIFASLPTFIDVFRLADTSHRLREVWRQHRQRIHPYIAVQCIECLQYACQLLQDQHDSPNLGGKGIDRNAIWSEQYIARLVQNTEVVKQKIAVIEEEVFSQEKSM
jgi:hypothetical protein